MISFTNKQQQMPVFSHGNNLSTQKQRSSPIFSAQQNYPDFHETQIQVQPNHQNQAVYQIGTQQKTFYQVPQFHAQNQHINQQQISPSSAPQNSPFHIVSQTSPGTQSATQFENPKAFNFFPSVPMPSLEGFDPQEPIIYVSFSFFLQKNVHFLIFC